MPSYDFDVVVIGGGAAGLTASGLAAALGAKTALIERDRTGGECTWSGCVPSKALLKAARVAHTMRTAAQYGLPAFQEPAIDFAKVIEAMHAIRQQIYDDADSPEQIRDRSVELFDADAVFIDPHTVGIGGSAPRIITSRYFIICTGSSAILPGVPGLPPGLVLTNANLFELQALPASLLVLGGGPIGIEMAQAFCRLGSRVTVVDLAEEILSNDEPEAARYIRRTLEAEGVRFCLGNSIDSVARDDRGYYAQISSGENWSSIRFDRLLAAIGRKPNVEGLGLEAAGVAYDAKGIRINHSCQTSVPHIYACGDVTDGLRFTHVAEDMAKTAVMRLLLKIPSTYERKSVPWVTFTDPETAHLGKTAAELREEKIRFETIRFPYEKIDRAVTDRTEGGFVMLHISPVAGKLYGAHIVGERAGEMINEFALAMHHGLTLRDISSTVHAYPTYLLGARRAADQWYVRQGSPRLVEMLKLLFGYRGRLPKNLGTDEIV